MLVRVVAHTHGHIQKIAEDASSALAGDYALAAAAYRMSLLCTVMGTGLGLLDGDLQLVGVRGVDLDDTLLFLPGMVFVPEVGDGSVPEPPLAHEDLLIPYIFFRTRASANWDTLIFKFTGGETGPLVDSAFNMTKRRNIQRYILTLCKFEI